MPSKKLKLTEVELTIEKVSLLLSKVGKETRKIFPCKVCKEVKKDCYRGICESCRKATSVSFAEKRQGKVWFRPDGYAAIYDSQGKPQLYSRFRMAQILGRALLPSESVTYKDDDKSNIADDNLMLTSKTGVVISELVCPHCERKFGE